jgi:glycine/D-amino acid oxidase-like deaminating enzyme
MKNNGSPLTIADVVIIGGGPAGTAAAWALDRLQPGIKIVLIEASERLGAGSSTASLECFRTCWPCLPMARQMGRSVEVFHHADEYLGEGATQQIALKQQGYLFCAMNERQTAVYAADVRRLHAIGLTHIEMLDADEVRVRFPWLGERVIAAKFDPVAGWLDSNALIHRFAASVRNLRVMFDVGDARICLEAGRVSGVETAQGMISTPHVLIANGASAKQIGWTAGVELPITMRPRQSFTTGWRHDAFPADAPLVIGGPPCPHVRPEAGTGATFGWEYSHHTLLSEPEYPAAPLRDARFPSLTLALLARQFGHVDGEGFADPRYLRGVHHNIGYYVYRDESMAYRVEADGTQHPYESERAIIDTVPGVEGLVVSVAHVGHGIMSAPASGEIAAAKVLGMPLPDPSYEAFGFDVPWVEYDEAVL